MVKSTAPPPVTASEEEWSRWQQAQDNLLSGAENKAYPLFVFYSALILNVIALGVTLWLLY